MLGMKKQPPVRSAIGPGMRVTGDCTFQDGLQVDGTVLGDVIVAAAVIAGQLQPQVTPPPAPVEPQAALAPAAEPAEPTLDPDRP